MSELIIDPKRFIAGKYSPNLKDNTRILYSILVFIFCNLETSY